MSCRLARPIIGIPWLRLSHGSPRGVVRVARAIAEQLVADPSLRLLAISEPVFEQNEVLFETMEMDDWLELHALETPASPPAVRRGRPAAAAQAVKLLKRAVTLAGLKEPARRAVNLSLKAGRKLKTKIIPPAPVQVEHRLCGTESPRSERRALRDFDAIVSFECYDPIWSWPVELSSCHLIGVFHDAIPLRINEGQFWNPGAYYRAVGAMVNRAAVIACDSESSERDLHAFFPPSRTKTRVVRLGHDRERFLPGGDGEQGAHRLAASRRLPGKRIAMIGEIEPRKNQAGVLRACQRLRSRRAEEPITLVLVGNQPSQNPYKFLEEQARKHVTIEHRGYVPDAKLGDVLRSCDAFLFPSLWEGFGIPVLEAMSAGVPVVCSDNSSLPEVAGEWAFYCDPYDPASIAAAIDRALDMSAEQRERWARGACAHAERFTWPAAAERFKELIADSLAETPTTTSRKPAPPRRTAAEEFCENAC